MKLQYQVFYASVINDSVKRSVNKDLSGLVVVTAHKNDASKTIFGFHIDNQQMYYYKKKELKPVEIQNLDKDEKVKIYNSIKFLEKYNSP